MEPTKYPKRGEIRLEWRWDNMGIEREAMPTMAAQASLNFKIGGNSGRIMFEAEKSGAKRKMYRKWCLGTKIECIPDLEHVRPKPWGYQPHLSPLPGNGTGGWGTQRGGSSKSCDIKLNPTNPTLH